MLSAFKRIIIVGILILLIIGLVYFALPKKKELKLIWPQGGEELRAGKTYQIKWKAREIGKIDIILVDGEGKREILAENFPASKKQFTWKILGWQAPRTDYKILIEAKETKEPISDSSKIFTIIGPDFFSCDQLSVENQWPFIPSDYPGIKRVFISSYTYRGDLGGLEKADAICQEEAGKKGLEGNWKAFLGDEDVSAKERLNLEGIFVDAEGFLLPQGNFVPNYFWESFKQYIQKLPTLQMHKESYLSAHKYLTDVFLGFLKQWNKQQETKYCYRLLGKNFDEFFQLLNSPIWRMSERLDSKFLSKLQNGVWLGRLNQEERKDCLRIKTGEYSFTTTCQNWYSFSSTLPAQKMCYDEEGNKVEATRVGGQALLFLKDKDTPVIIGEYCSAYLRLICIEQ